MLRLAAQRTAAPRSATIATSHNINIIPSSQPQNKNNLQLLLPTTQQLILGSRSFSSLQPNINNDSDDGGPVANNSSITDFSKLSNKALADMSTIPGWNLVHNPPRRNNPRGALVGHVVSDKMQKTVNVAVDRYKLIPKYRKRWRYTKKFMAHDEHEVCNAGDLVMIVPCQKISRHKHFMVREIIRPKGQL